MPLRDVFFPFYIQHLYFIYFGTVLDFYLVLNTFRSLVVHYSMFVVIYLYYISC